MQNLVEESSVRSNLLLAQNMCVILTLPLPVEELRLLTFTNKLHLSRPTVFFDELKEKWKDTKGWTFMFLSQTEFTFAKVIVSRRFLSRDNYNNQKKPQWKNSKFLLSLLWQYYIGLKVLYLFSDNCVEQKKYNSLVQHLFN